IGAFGTSYQLTPADVGFYIRVRATGTSAAGSSAATSRTTFLPVVSARPYAFTMPTSSGVAQSGATLTAGAAAWQNSPNTLTRQWWRCDVDGSGCYAIPDATDPSYVLTDDDVGSTIRVSEFRELVPIGNGRTLSNVVSSLQTGVVAAAPPPQPPPVPVPPSGGGGSGGGGGGGGAGGVPPDLHVDLTASATAPPPVGSELLYTIKVTTANVGSASDARLNVTLPAGFTVT